MCFCLAGMKVWAPHLAYCDTTMVMNRGDVTCYSRMKVEIQALHFAFARWGGAGSTVFSMVFDWSRTVVVQKFSIFLDWPFHDSLAKKERFSLTFYISAHWHFWVSGFSSTKSGIYKAKKKPGALTSSELPPGSEVLSWSDFLSPPFRIFLNLYIYTIHHFYLFP